MKTIAVPVETIIACARKLRLVGQIYDGDKESRRLADELDALAAAPPQSEPVVTVDKEGVRFGKWCWVSHERITGCEAALIPTKHKQYCEWFLANLRESTNAAPPQSEPAYEFIGQVAHDIANDGKCGPVVWWQSFRDFPDGTNIYAVRPTAPPHEPADHLAAPDSLERARNALRAITNAGSIGQAKRIAMQALGDGDQNDAPAAPASTLPLSAELRNARKVLDQYTATLRDGEPSLYLEAADRIDALESDLRGMIENAITYRRKIRELEQPLAGLKSEWFHRGQESVRRKNESGCCCKIGDDDKILSACDAHAEWAKQQLAEKDREIAELRRGISLCAELAELKAGVK